LLNNLNHLSIMNIYETENGTNLKNAVLLVSDSAGQYIPKEFAVLFQTQLVEQINSEDLNSLLIGPDDKWYLDSWDSLLNKNIVITLDVRRYKIEHDGDLWAIPVTE